MNYARAITAEVFRLFDNCVFASRSIFAALILIGLATRVHAATVTTTWNANRETNIAGYILSYGTQSGTYTTSVDVGNVTTWQLTLNAGRYFFVVRAYNSNGQQSPNSMEVMADIGYPPSPLINSISPTWGGVGTNVTIAGANFGAAQGSSTVRFNGTTATPTSWTASSILVPVPAGATTGSVVVTVSDIASNGVGFAVTSLGLPTLWSSQDIGDPFTAGGAIYFGGTFVLGGAGVDIWGTADQFQFVYQTLDGDGIVFARVNGMQNVDLWTKTGVMIRQDLTASSANAFALITPLFGVHFQQRLTGGGATTDSSFAAGAAPRWLVLSRRGNVFTAYVSTDALNWTPIGNAVTISMASRVYAGLALTSHNATAAALASFSGVGVWSATSSGPMPTVGSSSAAVGATTADPTAAQPTGERASRGMHARSDYDGDGRDDLALFRPATGTWLLRPSGPQASGSLSWGSATDIPVPGDYDGDGKTDPAYYRPATGTWSVLRSGTNFTTDLTVSLPEQGDVPVPSDFDGDGITDVAAYSSSTGRWTVRMSSADYAAVKTFEWGARNDIPAPHDFDGDGKADLAVYRPATGEWRILNSSSGYTTSTIYQLGGTGDRPVPADYDGDGIADPAVFNPATGTWRALLSSLGFRTVELGALGGSSAIPVPGDYDGDGKADLAVFRDGEWRILYSGVSYQAGETVAFGAAGDQPPAGSP